MRVPAGSMFIEMKHNFSFVTTCSAKRQRSYPILKIEQVYRSKTFESLVLLGKAHRIRPQTVELKWCYFNQRKSNHFCKSLFLCAFRFHFHFDYHSRFVSLQISFNAVWIYIKLIDSMTNVKLKSTLRVQFQRIFSKKKKIFPWTNFSWFIPCFWFGAWEFENFAVCDAKNCLQEKNENEFWLVSHCGYKNKMTIILDDSNEKKN